MFLNKTPAHSCGSHGFVLAKSCTNIGCSNCRILGSLSEQSAQLRAVLDIMKSKNMDLLTLNESPWPGSELFSVCDSTSLRSGSPSSHTHGVVIILNLCAKAAWDAVKCVFQPVPERILGLHLKCHMSYKPFWLCMLLPTHPTPLLKLSVPLTNSSPLFPPFPSSDHFVIFGNFNACVGLNFPLQTRHWSSPCWRVQQEWRTIARLFCFNTRFRLAPRLGFSSA